MIVLQTPVQNYTNGTTTWITDKLDQSMNRVRLTFTRGGFPQNPGVSIGTISLFFAADGVSFPAQANKVFDVKGGDILDPNGTPYPSQFIDLMLTNDESPNRRVKVVFTRTASINTGIIVEGVG